MNYAAEKSIQNYEHGVCLHQVEPEDAIKEREEGEGDLFSRFTLSFVSCAMRTPDPSESSLSSGFTLTEVKCCVVSWAHSAIPKRPCVWRCWPTRKVRYAIAPSVVMMKEKSSNPPSAKRRAVAVGGQRLILT